MLLTLASNAGLVIGVLTVKNGFSSIYDAVYQPLSDAPARPPTLTYASQRSTKNARMPSSFLTSCRRTNLTVRRSATSLRGRLTSSGDKGGDGPVVVPVYAPEIAAGCQRDGCGDGRTVRLWSPWSLRCCRGSCGRPSGRGPCLAGDLRVSLP